VIPGVLAQSPQPAAPQSPQRLWITQAGQSGDRGVTLSVRVDPEYTLPATLHIECDLESVDPIDHVAVTLSVVDSTDVPAFESKLVVDAVQGMSPCLFTWDTAGLKNGVYRVELSAVRSSSVPLANLTLIAEVISEGDVLASLNKAEAAASAMSRLVESLASSGKPSLLGTMRSAIASDALPKARAAHAQGDWRRARTSANAIIAMMQGLALELAFRGATDGPHPSLAPAGLSKLDVRDGDFYSGGQPVYLIGTLGGDELPDTFPTLHRYGLNLAVYTISPEQTLAGAEISSAFKAPLDRLFDAAYANNISVAVQLAPHRVPASVLEKWPALTEKGGGSFPYDLTTPQARTLIESHLRAVATHVAGRPMLNSLILAENPEFRMEGEAVRQGFIASVRSTYNDRNTMNRLWRTRYLDFDEIVLDWALERPPYQYDLQMYHRKLGTEFLSWMASLANTAAPGTPVQVECSDHVFRKGESSAGIDREALAHAMDIQGCSTLAPPGEINAYTLIAEHGMYYTLLRSLNPQTPVFDSECCLHKDLKANSFALLRSLAWDGILSGADALAIPFKSTPASPLNLLDDPEAINGLVTACQEVNRLSTVVSAFQAAPSPVAILWSTSSHIYKDGDPFADSVRNAYLGCNTFGYSVRFITEDQCASGELDGIKILVIPAVLALTDAAFEAVDSYMEKGGVTIRSGEPIPYNPYGHSRNGSLTAAKRTVFLRGSITPDSYLHALDSANDLLGDTQFPRPINEYDYPLEKVKSRFCAIDGVHYLYLINLRDDAAALSLQGGYTTGRDLISGSPVVFPQTVAPLSPMLIRLDEPNTTVAQDAATAQEKSVPSATVEPVGVETNETKGANTPGKTSHKSSDAGKKP
jgi:hypothetical protein